MDAEDDVDRGAILDRRAKLVAAALAALAASDCGPASPPPQDGAEVVLTAQASEGSTAPEPSSAEASPPSPAPVEPEPSVAEPEPSGSPPVPSASAPAPSAAPRPARTSAPHPCLCICKPKDPNCDCL